MVLLSIAMLLNPFIVNVLGDVVLSLMVECESNTVKSTHPSRLEVVSLSSSTFRGGGRRDQIFVACLVSPSVKTWGDKLDT
jgi:hypothetical protein